MFFLVVTDWTAGTDCFFWCDCVARAMQTVTNESVTQEQLGGAEVRTAYLVS